MFKNDQMLWFVKKQNEKLLRFVIIFLWEVIYIHFYNWDRPLDLVSVVYDLIDWSLKLHSSLRTIPHLILTHNTQVLVQLMLISLVWLYMIKCDVYHSVCDHTYYGIPFLRPSAYKARVGGVSPRYRIEQIYAGGSKAWLYPSQSGQYLIGEKFVPPTNRI